MSSTSLSLSIPSTLKMFSWWLGHINYGVKVSILCPFCSH